jgi:hypothetical protein
MNTKGASRTAKNMISLEIHLKKKLILLNSGMCPKLKRNAPFTALPTLTLLSFCSLPNLFYIKKQPHPFVPYPNCSTPSYVEEIRKSSKPCGAHIWSWYLMS